MAVRGFGGSTGSASKMATSQGARATLEAFEPREGAAFWSYGTSARYYYEAAHDPWTPVSNRARGRGSSRRFLAHAELSKCLQFSSQVRPEKL